MELGPFPRLHGKCAWTHGVRCAGRLGHWASLPLLLTLSSEGARPGSAGVWGEKASSLASVPPMLW